MPVQVNYLGYAGTLGRDDCDYIVADRFVVPEESQVHYTEKVVYLPDSFMVNDSGRAISAARAVTGRGRLAGARACLLLLQQQLQDHARGVRRLDAAARRDRRQRAVAVDRRMSSAPNNLRREAEKRGVAADRLVFASGVPLNEDHLARLRHADLFLDTTPYNAHATACDALWAGVPVLTCSGATFASRVAGSLLGAVGLPELITGVARGLRGARAQACARSGAARLAAAEARAQPR